MQISEWIELFGLMATVGILGVFSFGVILGNWQDNSDYKIAEFLMSIGMAFSILFTLVGIVGSIITLSC